MDGYQIGDKVWVEGEIVGHMSGKPLVNFKGQAFPPFPLINSIDYVYLGFDPKVFKKHIKKEKPITEKCTVMYAAHRSHTSDPSYHGYVHSIHGNDAWVIWNHPTGWGAMPIPGIIINLDQLVAV